MSTIDQALECLEATCELVAVRREVSAPCLPRIGVDQRLAPHPMLRGALFAARGRESRERLDRVELATLADVRVLYTGERLGQEDLDLWLALLHLAEAEGLGRATLLTEYQLCRARGMADDGGDQRRVLRAGLERLAGALVQIQRGEAVFMGHLVQSAKRNSRGAWRVVLDPDLARLLEPGGYVTLDWPTRCLLRRKPLAQWLHAYFSSQPDAFPLSLQRLRALSGSKAVHLRSFRATVKRALEQVSAACNARGHTFKWEFDMRGCLLARLRRGDAVPARATRTC